MDGAAQGSDPHSHAVEEVAPRDSAMHSELAVSLLLVHGAEI